VRGLYLHYVNVWACIYWFLHWPSPHSFCPPYSPSLPTSLLLLVYLQPSCFVLFLWKYSKKDDTKPSPTTVFEQIQFYSYNILQCQQTVNSTEEESTDSDGTLLYVSSDTSGKISLVQIINIKYPPQNALFRVVMHY